METNIVQKVASETGFDRINRFWIGRKKKYSQEEEEEGEQNQALD